MSCTFGKDGKVSINLKLTSYHKDCCLFLIVILNQLLQHLLLFCPLGHIIDFYD
jgi:hypothetical protein